MTNLAADDRSERVSLGMRCSEAFGSWALRRLARRIEVVGLENVPLHGAAILAGNHISWVDPVFLACSLTPAIGRPLNWMGKAEEMRWPVVGRFLRVNGVFGVRRGAADLEAFRLAEKLLASGHLLGIYPEGTRSHDGRLGAFREGAALLALRSGVPVLPVAVSGTHRLWRRGSLLPRRVAHIRLVIGTPLHLERGDGRGAVQRAAEQIRAAVAALLPPEHLPAA